MTGSLKTAIRIGGALNFLFLLFHFFLDYQIFLVYGSSPVYPLLEMLAIGGTILIFFQAYTSLFCADELAATKLGTAVLRLNIAVYVIRIIGEYALFPQPKIAITVSCAIMAAIYIYVCTGTRRLKMQPAAAA